MKEEPDWTRVPARVRPLLRRCLEKDPKKRLRDISGVELLLEQAPPESSRGRRRWLWPSATALFALAAGLLAFALFRETPPAPEQVRFQKGTAGKVALVENAPRNRSQPGRPG